MEKKYGALLVVILLVVLGIAGALAKTAFQAPAGPVNKTITGFTVAHPALRPGERTSVRVSVGDNARGGVTYAWKAEAGALSAVDTNPVLWTAPESEGRYQVSVEVTDAAGSRSGGSAEILVSNYPANPLIMSVSPAGCKTAKQ